VIQSLAYTIGADRELITQFDRFRKKRIIGEYDRAGTVSDQEAGEMVALAKNLRDDLYTWLRTYRPELL
jgi:hypothetical protein